MTWYWNSEGMKHACAFFEFAYYALRHKERAYQPKEPDTGVNVAPSVQPGKAGLCKFPPQIGNASLEPLFEPDAGNGLRGPTPKRQKECERKGAHTQTPGRRVHCNCPPAIFH